MSGHLSRLDSIFFCRILSFEGSEQGWSRADMSGHLRLLALFDVFCRIFMHQNMVGADDVSGHLRPLYLMSFVEFLRIITRLELTCLVI